MAGGERRELGAYRERVDLVGAALLEGVVVPRPPRHGSPLPSPIDVLPLLLCSSLPSFPSFLCFEVSKSRRTTRRSRSASRSSPNRPQLRRPRSSWGKYGSRRMHRPIAWGTGDGKTLRIPRGFVTGPAVSFYLFFLLFLCRQTHHQPLQRTEALHHRWCMTFGFAAPAPPRHLDSDVAFGDVRIACLRVHDRHDAGKPFGSHILYSVKKLEQTAPFPTKKKVNTVCL